MLYLYCICAVIVFVQCFCICAVCLHLCCVFAWILYCELCHQRVITYCNQLQSRWRIYICRVWLSRSQSGPTHISICICFEFRLYLWHVCICISLVFVFVLWLFCICVVIYICRVWWSRSHPDHYPDHSHQWTAQGICPGQIMPLPSRLISVVFLSTDAMYLCFLFLSLSLSSLSWQSHPSKYSIIVGHFQFEVHIMPL